MVIPKILHFCWFGGSEPPQQVKDCLESWREHMPDYKIMEWNDDNVPDVGYVHAALKNRKFANVSNYVRFHAIHEHGGIYLDTDIEVVKSFDPLLTDGMFAGWQQNGQVNNAVLGGSKGHWFIRKCMLELPKRFGGLEKANLSSPFFITAMLKEAGVITNKNFNTYLAHDDGISIYPTRFFYPHWHTEKLDREKHITENTFCIHHWAGTWK